MQYANCVAAFARSWVASKAALSSRSPLLRLLIPAVVVFLLLGLYLLATVPVPDRSAIWLPPTHESQGLAGQLVDDDDDGYPPETDASMKSAGNSTLGFGSVNFLYLSTRFDRLDAMSLQSYLSGIDVTEQLGVGPEMIKDAGMPPTQKPRELTIGEKGCWRAHANIWSAMLRQKLPPVLVLESDATWDVKIRQIMPRLNHHFRQFLADTKSAALPRAGWSEPAKVVAGNGSFDAAPAEDPWLSSHWDVLFLGQCHDTIENKEVHRIYKDPSVPAGRDYWGRTLQHERVIRRSGGIICTTAYAVSETGAAKLLLRSAVNLDMPVDLMMREMILSGDLVSYSVTPPIFAQYQYAEGIGMEERGANSNIRGGQLFSAFFSFFIRRKAWENVRLSGSVWTTKRAHEDVAFNEMALQSAWRRIFGTKKTE
ncbi:hypothetical protein DCS_06874 [Drechmeria coniospora]|uniref:Glycosyl transferase family 25 domain-containing protein n=1 Tax=Drechmeria coniospora TaxID=98403 RepID=A0A151GCW5_DRECN|nr:hypothetical protein DCS_06874 [Drechmeria coniospora]KYK54913.1 hypothetical protein DCS_06874 [Drechmeria coniospora]ODA75854.1 hypothetical protein RJ55_08495 [Drechmeria coniospora]